MSITMKEGKQLGKGLIYISDLNQTASLEYINSLDEEQFSMLLSFCNHRELDKLYSLTESSKSCYKSAQVLMVMTSAN